MHATYPNEHWKELPVNDNLYSLDDSIGLQMNYSHRYVLSPEPYSFYSPPHKAAGSYSMFPTKMMDSDVVSIQLSGYPALIPNPMGVVSPHPDHRGNRSSSFSPIASHNDLRIDPQFDLSLPNLQDVMEDDAHSTNFLMSSPLPGSTTRTLYDRPISARSPYEPSHYRIPSSMNPLERHSSMDYSLLSPQSHDSTRRTSPYPPIFKSGPVSPYILSPYPPSELQENRKMTPGIPIPSGEPTLPALQPSPKVRPMTASTSTSTSTSTVSASSFASFRGHVMELAKTYNGCRLLQQAILHSSSSVSAASATATEELLEEILGEIRGNLADLMMDPFGNYVIQRLVEVGTAEQRLDMVVRIQSHLVEIAMNIHGTRCIQSLVINCSSTPMAQCIVQGLQGHVAQLASHSNGNHVIQRCLHAFSEDVCRPVFQELVEHCIEIAMHRYGCCIIQQCFTLAPEPFHRALVDAIVHDASLLLVDPFGNYVIQYVLDNGSREERSRIIQTSFGRIVDYSCQKYSSNVVEKIIALGDEAVRYRVVEEIIRSPHFSAILHHSYANYIIQSLFHYCGKENVCILYKAILPFKGELNRSTGGRHILGAMNVTMCSSPNSAN